jgi:hypothetical protein
MRCCGVRNPRFGIYVELEGYQRQPKRRFGSDSRTRQGWLGSELSLIQLEIVQGSAHAIWLLERQQLVFAVYVFICFVRFRSLHLFHDLLGCVGIKGLHIRNNACAYAVSEDLLHLIVKFMVQVSGKLVTSSKYRGGGYDLIFLKHIHHIKVCRRKSVLTGLLVS